MTIFHGGQTEHLQDFATWLDHFESAIVRLHDENEYIYDIKILREVLASRKSYLSCFNAVEIQKCSDLIGHLQREIGICLADGLSGVCNPSPEQQQAALDLQNAFNNALSYFRWLGVQVRRQLEKNNSAFIPSETQRDILAALNGSAMTVDELEKAINRSRSTLFKNPGGLKELIKKEMIQKNRMIGGYYRPDAPPISDLD